VAQVPEETEKDNERSESCAGLDRVPRAAKRVDRHQYGDAVVFENDCPVMKSKRGVGNADDRTGV
jgi:hypothetical protein